MPEQPTSPVLNLSPPNTKETLSNNGLLNVSLQPQAPCSHAKAGELWGLSAARGCSARENRCSLRRSTTPPGRELVAAGRFARPS